LLACLLAYHHPFLFCQTQHHQLSDYAEERWVPDVLHPPADARDGGNGGSTVLSVACGSAFAGIVTGYLSHVPHTLSTLKLTQPGRTYV